MRKTLLYPAFALSTFVVVLLFVTATSYTQIIVGTLLYPVLCYLTLSLFPRRNRKDREILVQVSTIDHNEEPANAVAHETKQTVQQPAEIDDTDRRAFLKLIGVTGISFFLLSIFSKKAQLPFLGKLGGGTAADSVTVKDTTGETIDPAERQPLDGYQISEIDDSTIAYYGFINKKGEWYIMREDTESSSFRYAKGDSSFPQGWTNRARLKYDYFHNI